MPARPLVSLPSAATIDSVLASGLSRRPSARSSRRCARSDSDDHFAVGRLAGASGRHRRGLEPVAPGRPAIAGRRQSEATRQEDESGNERGITVLLGARGAGGRVGDWRRVERRHVDRRETRHSATDDGLCGVRRASLHGVLRDLLRRRAPARAAGSGRDDSGVVGTADVACTRNAAASRRTTGARARRSRRGGRGRWRSGAAD